MNGCMDRKPKYVAQIENVYFVRRIGASLRQATADIAREDLPENIRHLLRRWIAWRPRIRSETNRADTAGGQRKLEVVCPSTVTRG